MNFRILDISFLKINNKSATSQQQVGYKSAISQQQVAINRQQVAMEPFSTLKIKYQLKENDESRDSALEAEIKIYDYSDLSIVMICDENFGKSFAETFKTIGKYNGKLKIGKGWVFAKKNYGNLQQIVNDIISFKIKGEKPVDYTAKNIVSIDGPLGSLPSQPPIVKDFKKLMLTLIETKDKNLYTLNDKTYLWGDNDSVNSTLSEMGKISSVVYEIRTPSHSLVIF